MKLFAVLLLVLAACGSVTTPSSGDDTTDPFADDAPDDPTVPHLSVSTDGADAIHVEWTAVDNSAGYQLWRSETEDGEQTLLAEIERDATLAYDDGGLLPSDVKWYQVLSCDAAGCPAPAPSVIKRGSTRPGAIALLGCSRGTSANTITCSWTGAENEIDGEVGYEIHARDPAGTVTTLGSTADTAGTFAAPPGILYGVTVAIANSETGVGPDSNEQPGYAESAVIVYDDNDAADTARATALAAVLATDVVATGAGAGTMPTVPAALLPASMVSSTASVPEAWAGRPMILSPGFSAISDEGRLRNVTSASRSMLALGPSVAIYDTINSLGGDWGPGAPPYTFSYGYSDFGGYTDAVIYYAEGDIFTWPLYATGYGPSPLEGTAEGYTSTPTTVTALMSDGFDGAQRLCWFDAAIVDWWACAQHGNWGWLGYLDPPDTDAGQVLLINFVARLAQQ
jgi:hypothetical protein